jgi:4-hydroxy-tetrahydrodipicolinate reductase
VVARLDSEATSEGITRDALNGADVAVEFTVPHAAARNVRAIVAAGCPVVVGTTGWYDELPSIREEVASRGGALLNATNFSLGVNIFEQIVEVAARLLGRAPGVGLARIVETHHAASSTRRREQRRRFARRRRPHGRETGEIQSRVFDGIHPRHARVHIRCAVEQIHLEHRAIGAYLPRALSPRRG